MSQRESSTGRTACVLVVLSTVLQGVVASGMWQVDLHSPSRLWLSLLEMALMLALLLNGLQITRGVLARAREGQADAKAASWVAKLSLASLAVCVIGDGINRNFSQQFFRHDTVVEHSYLADSVWAFFPGYALWILAAALATRARIPQSQQVLSLLVVAAFSAFSFFNMVLPGTSHYVQVLTGSYAVLIGGMTVAGAWLLWQFGRPALAVAIGAVLATVADALIGQFWLYGHGHYPLIASINWVIYFASQALIQRLPLLVERLSTSAR